jgi:hypothetical protein
MISIKLWAHRRRLRKASSSTVQGDTPRDVYGSVISILVESSIFYTLSCVMVEILMAPRYANNMPANVALNVIQP